MFVRPYFFDMIEMFTSKSGWIFWGVVFCNFILLPNAHCCKEIYVCRRSEV